MNSRLFCLFALWGLALTLYAQESKIPPLPAGPLLKRTPEFSTWSVSIQGTPLSGAPDAAQKNSPTGERNGKTAVTAQSEVTKTGATILRRDVDAKGNLSEHWHVKDLRIMKLPDSPTPIVCPDFGGEDIYSVNFAVSDFAGLDWVSAKTYAGIEKLEGKDCIVFKGMVSPLSTEARNAESRAIIHAEEVGEPPLQELKVAAVAYIDLETRLPVSVTFGDEKRTYQYGAPPTTALAVPPDLMTHLKGYLLRIERLSAPAGKPF